MKRTSLPLRRRDQLGAPEMILVGAIAPHLLGDGAGSTAF
jgi:hypothetical protein